ncbi:MAG: DUF366 family protein [Planctomycetes bacterium]|nr:DUF366 family protein [Planctomycetota bacterium]
MIARFLSKKIKYDGSQIASLWTYRQTGLTGNGIVAFIGPCQIPAENIVDIEDLRNGKTIAGPLMLHFIIELFEMDLEKAILHQRLFAAITMAILEKHIGYPLSRKGDDIYDGPAKLSISVATLTPVSSKIHFALNIVSKGTPVKTKGLKDYKIPPEKIAHEIMNSFVNEIIDIKNTRCKVRGAP